MSGQIAAFPYAVTVLGQKAAGYSLTGATGETQLGSTVPLGVLGPNDAIRVTTLWSVNNNGNAKTGRVRIGGLTGTQIMALNMASTVTYQLTQIMRNRGATNSQVFQVVTATSSFTNSGGIAGTAAIDTSTSQDLVFSGQLANGADSITLEAYTVEYLPGR